MPKDTSFLLAPVAKTFAGDGLSMIHRTRSYMCTPRNQTGELRQDQARNMSTGTHSLSSIHAYPYPMSPNFPSR